LSAAQWLSSALRDAAAAAFRAASRVRLEQRDVQPARVERDAAGRMAEELAARLVPAPGRER